MDLVIAIIGCTFAIITTMVGVAVKLTSRLTRLETRMEPLLGISEIVASHGVEIDNLKTNMAHHLAAHQGMHAVLQAQSPR